MKEPDADDGTTNKRKWMGLPWRLEQVDGPKSNGFSFLYDGSADFVQHGRRVGVATKRRMKFLQQNAEKDI